MAGRQYHMGFLVLVVFALATCTNSDRSNPIHNSTAVENLFIPQINTPGGGEQWFPGSSQVIRWSFATEVTDSTVTIELVCDTDTTLIAENIPNNGQYQWIVPNRPSLSCRIKITGRGGASISPGVFSINPTPIENQLQIGEGGGWDPTALREQVIFTSNRHDDDGDLYLLNRENGMITRLTFHEGFDGEAALFKQSGKLVAYTSTSVSDQKNIWMMPLEGPQTNQAIQITTNGGREPAWQNQGFTRNFSIFRPSLVFKELDGSRPIVVTLNTSILTIPFIELPLTFTIPPTPLFFGFNELHVNSPFTWGLNEPANVIVYAVGGSTPHLVRKSFTRIDFQATSDVPLGLPLATGTPLNPTLSPTDEYIAFSLAGNIWVTPVDGVVAFQLTIGDEVVDDAPDWSSETEIVFQRRPVDTMEQSAWALWAVQVQRLP